MARATEPESVDHPELQEFAREAVWVAKLEDALGLLEDLVVEMEDMNMEDDIEGSQTSDGERLSKEDEPYATALNVVSYAWEEADRALEDRVFEWLCRDPEHWPIFRLVILDPWQASPGHWRHDTPGWVMSLGTNVIYTHFNWDPYGRGKNNSIDPDNIPEFKGDLFSPTGADVISQDWNDFEIAQGSTEISKTERVADPGNVEPPQLRELALAAALVAKLEEASAELRDLTAVTTLGPNAADPPEGVFVDDRALWEVEPLFVIQDLVDECWFDERMGLEVRVAGWLAADPQHWKLFRRLVFDPWQTARGKPSKGTPRWLLLLGALKSLAPYTQTPYRLRPTRATGQIRSSGDRF